MLNCILMSMCFIIIVLTCVQSGPLLCHIPIPKLCKIAQCKYKGYERIGKGEMAEHSIISLMTHTKEPRKGHSIKIPVPFAYIGSIR